MTDNDDNGTLDPPPGVEIKTITLDELLGKKVASADATLQHMLELSVDETLEPKDRIAAARVAMAKIIADKKAVDVVHTHTLQDLTDDELERRINQILANRQQGGTAGPAVGTGAPTSAQKAH